ESAAPAQAVAGVGPRKLPLLGLAFVGEELLGANASNPHGHFEDMDFIKVHERIFDENGESWLAPNPFVPIVSRSLRAHVAALVGGRDAAHHQWGFKDPRACLFVDVWRTMLSRPRFLVCLRHYRACVDSVVRRALSGVRTTVMRPDARTQMLLASDHDAIARSWIAHMLPLLRLMRHHPAIVHAVTMGDLNGSIAADLRDRFGFDLAPVPLRDTFDATLFKADEDVEIAISSDVAALAERVWRELLDAQGETSVHLDAVA
ncbi:MAG: hypothetical protein AAGF49_03705, partial [Pseudomonadota bacterium]